MSRLKNDFHFHLYLMFGTDCTATYCTFFRNMYLRFAYLSLRKVIHIAYVLTCIASRSSDIYQHGTKIPIVFAFSSRQISPHVPVTRLSSAE